MSFLSSNSEEINTFSNPLYVDPKKCLFCPKLTSIFQTYTMLNKALFLKYSSSQNYYYSKDIQELIDNARKPVVITFKDSVMLEEKEEYLTRLYKSNEHNGKLIYLSEYYKYHKEVPRLFMQPASGTINHFHDKKRRIDYYKIKRMLAEQKKGVIVTGNKDDAEIFNESDDSERPEHSKDNKGEFFEKKLISHILENLDISMNLNKSLEKDLNKKKFTINKSIKNKNANIIEKPLILENSGISLRELEAFLDKIVVRPKEINKHESLEDIQTLIPTEMTDIFFEEDQTVLNNCGIFKKNKVFLENNKISPKNNNVKKNLINKPILQIPTTKTNNFLSPKNVMSNEMILKKPQIFSEKINGKFIPLDNMPTVDGIIKKSSEISISNNTNTFKKKKSYSINSAKDHLKDFKSETFFKKLLENKELSNPSTLKNPSIAKYFSPEKSPDPKLITENKLRKVEKFIKIYKNSSNSNPLQKFNTNRDLGSKTQGISSNLSHNINETLQNLSKMSNSKSFSEKQNNTKHRRINSSSNPTINPKNTLKRYQNDIPLEKVQEILSKGRTPSTGLKVQNNNTLHRKMPSEIYTPKEKISNLQQFHNNNKNNTESKFWNNHIMSRNQVNNKIKYFNNPVNIQLSTAQENISEFKRRNKSLDTAKKTEINLGNRNLIKKSDSTKISHKDIKQTIGNLKHSINTREYINPGKIFCKT